MRVAGFHAVWQIKTRNTPNFLRKVINPLVRIAVKLRKILSLIIVASFWTDIPGINLPYPKQKSSSLSPGFFAMTDGCLKIRLIKNHERNHVEQFVLDFSLFDPSISSKSLHSLWRRQIDLFYSDQVSQMFNSFDFETPVLCFKLKRPRLPQYHDGDDMQFKAL